MTRLRQLSMDEMSAEQLELANALLSSRRAGQHDKIEVARGPFNAWFRIPAFGLLAERMGAFCRYETSLSPLQSELCILVVACRYRSAFEFELHARMAQQAGLSENAIAALLAGRSPEAELGEPERLIYRFCHQLCHRGQIEEAVYQEAAARFGEQALVEIVAVVGYYSLVSLALNAFEVQSEAPVDFGGPA
jgi:4-carboxymuconolactone decarboxylase